MFYIIDCGIVYELTRTQYKKLLKQIAVGGEYNLGNYGKPQGQALSVVGLSPEQAASRLSRLVHTFSHRALPASQI